MNNDKFRRSIANKINKAKSKHGLFVQRYVMELQSAVIEKTPVDTGMLHWNWFIGNGLINTTTEEHQGTNRSGAIARNNRVIESIKVNGQVIYLSNSLPYAYRIEYEGWSNQAPAGMLRISLIESESIARKIGLEVKNL